MDYRTEPRKTMEATRREAQAVLEDPRFPNDLVRHEEAMRIVREGQRRHAEVRRRAEEAYMDERERLQRQANAEPARAPRSTQELLERESRLRRLERRWDRNPDGIVEMYKRAIANGDEVEAELHEEVAGEFITDQARRAEFRDLSRERRLARMPASARTAAEQLERLEAEEGSVFGGMAHQKFALSNEMDKLRESRGFASQNMREMARNATALNGGRDEQ